MLLKECLRASNRKLLLLALVSGCLATSALAQSPGEPVSDGFPAPPAAPDLLPTKEAEGEVELQSFESIRDEIVPREARAAEQVRIRLGSAKPLHPPAANPSAPAPSAAASVEASEAMIDRFVDDQPETASIRPSQFQGIVPGRSTTGELKQKWGEPTQRVGDSNDQVWIYETSAFKRIAVNLVDGRVRSILVEFEKPFRPEALAERLKLTAIDPLAVVDSHGAAIGRAFPERGVIFSFKPDTANPAVAQLLLEPISADLFLQRVQSRMHERYAECFRDLQSAEKTDPRQPRTAWYRSRILLDLGRVTEALQSVDAAIKLDSRAAEYQFTRAECLAQLGRHDEAVATVKQTLASIQDTKLPAAEGMVTLAKLLAHGPEPDYNLAVKLYTEAVRLAEPLSRDANAATAKQANHLLVVAHLGVAYSIGWGNWQSKVEMVAKWLDHAEAYALQAPEQDGWRDALRFEVLIGRLAAHAGFDETDPEQWVDDADTLTGELSNRVEDPQRHQTLRWRLGEAYAFAAEIANLRKDAELGLEYAQLAKVGLEQGAEDRRDSLAARYRVGRLYFVTGALHAAHRQDHEKAVEWFTKAAPLLTAKGEKLPADPGRLGESLVSMGVSFWEVGLRQKAIELTERGAQLMKASVDSGNLHAKALTVPLGNLAAMHQALGDGDRAQAFKELAERDTKPTRK